MKQSIQVFRSELYKFLNSYLVWIHILVPISGSVVFLAYYSISSWNEVGKVTTYLQIIAMAFPMLIGIITAISSENEIQAGSFQNMLSAPCQKYVIHLSKLLVILLFGFLATTIACLGFGVGFRFMGNTQIAVSIYFQSIVILFIANIPIYLFHYIISLHYGKGATLGIGIIESLLSALLLTGLGDGIWMMIPCGIATRLVSILVGSDLLQSTFICLTEVKTALIWTAILTIILILLSGLWSTKWEGRKNAEI